MTTSSDERWSGSDHGHQNGRGHHMNMNMNMNMGLDNNSPSSGSNNWFSSLDDEDNILEYFLNGGENSGTLPPTPEGEPLSNTSTNAVSSDVNIASNSVPLNQTYAMMGPPPNDEIASQEQQQQQQPHHQQQGSTQKNQIRFSADNNNNNNNNDNTTQHVNTPGIYASFSNNTKKRANPPTTPAVQHFYARPSSSSTSQQKVNQQQQPQTVTSDISVGEIHHFHHQHQTHAQHLQLHQEKHPGKPTQPRSILYTAGTQRIANSSGLSNSKTPSSSSSSSLSSIGSSAVYQSSVPSSSCAPPSIMQVQQQFQSQNQQQQQRQQQQSQNKRASKHQNFGSPISPAAMCTSELMVFPSVHPYGSTQPRNGNGNVAGATNTQHQQWQQQIAQQAQSVPGAAVSQINDQVHNHIAHTSWLQHVNNIAMNTVGIGVKQPNTTSVINNSMPPPPPQATYYTTSTSQTPGCSDNTAQQQQSQHMYIRAMAPHVPQPGSAMNADILPIPSATNSGLLSNAAAAAALHNHHFSNPSTTSNASSAIETEEKRARRLARNRESARQSRRRKKELLINLEAQVDKLNTEIESERRRQLTTMEKDLMQMKSTLLKNAFIKLKDGKKQGGDLLEKSNMEVEEMLNLAIRYGGPNIAIRRAAADFQYNALSQLILPCYQQFFLSMSLQTESFFTGAKEKRSKFNKGTGRISSKLVGEEIHKSSKKPSQSCNVVDGDKVWPLLCYELTVSLDQEERLLQAFRSIREDASMPQNRSKVAVAGTMVSNLKHGTLYQSHSAAHRNETGLLQILTPEQALAYINWISMNRERCKKLFGLDQNRSKNNQVNGSHDSVEGSEGMEGGGLKNSDSLSDMCKQLTEAMMIQRTDL